ncbi:hypothetical protein FEM48_Zijuj01G0020500 [Ziziphus jujuba var. spinosa]|uniref:Sodium transporter HKT1-like n=1 Tax=Ziziphus jujuba var. spinosa TaxID=714518 RepID=A0A978VYH7_ZIZJJ|nr:hypothetical protein FEM48_Zijuj01G0020500 [Ziziphus jujuba var. spinosa]
MNSNNLDTSLICHNNLESSPSCNRIACNRQSIKDLIRLFFHFLVFDLNPFWIQLAYFVILSFFGYVALKITKPRTSLKPKDLDLFFTPVSSTMVSSMGTVEMEVFSNIQLVIMTILMLIGGEVFVSMLGLQLSRFKLHISSGDRVEAADPSSTSSVDYKSFTTYNSIECLGSVVLGYLLVVHTLGYILVTKYTTWVPSAN